MVQTMHEILRALWPVDSSRLDERYVPSRPTTVPEVFSWKIGDIRLIPEAKYGTVEETVDFSSIRLCFDRWRRFLVPSIAAYLKSHPFLFGKVAYHGM